MLVGRQWEETTIYRAAHALEQSGVLRNRGPDILRIGSIGKDKGLTAGCCFGAL